MASDYYKILGLSRSASADDIKQAYRKLSKEWHPDKHKGDKKAVDKFKEINEAYEGLNDPKKKQMYDQFGSTGSGSGAGSGGFGGGQGFGGFDFSGFAGGQRVDVGDLFEGFFGGGRKQPREERGGDREVEIGIDFTDTVTGARKEMQIKKLRACDMCSGSGAEKGSKLITCPDCGGTGQIMKTAQSFFGTIQQAMQCPRCKSSGKVPEKACSKCSGEGRISDVAKITLDIPAGIDDGQTLRVRGEGDAGRQGAPAGELYVHVRVRADARFTREGDDIRTVTSINVPDAILGSEIAAETVHGSTTLKIPAGTQSGQVFRIKQKGMPVLNTSRFGDHYVTVTVEIPAKLSREERKLVEEWKRLS